MKRFKVDVTKTIGFTATVEAHDAEDAWEIVAELESYNFDVNSREETEEEVEGPQGVSLVSISPAEEDDFEVHYPAEEVSE